MLIDNQSPIVGNLCTRAYLRDRYAELFNRGFIIDRMAYTDYEVGFIAYGRIEIVEKIALNVMNEPHNFHLNREEKHYLQWLREYMNGRERNQFLRDFFLYGVPNQTSVQLQGKIA